MHRSTCFNNKFSVKRESVEFKEPESAPIADTCDDPVMQDKRQIIEARVILKENKKKHREKMIPGAKLLMKLHKKQRLEDSLVRVVKNLSFGKDY